MYIKFKARKVEFPIKNWNNSVRHCVSEVKEVPHSKEPYLNAWIPSKPRLYSYSSLYSYLVEDMDMIFVILQNVRDRPADKNLAFIDPNKQKPAPRPSLI
jgi:hypothetical protein